MNSSPYFVAQNHLKEKPDYLARSQSLKLKPQETFAMNKATQDTSKRLLSLLSMDELEPPEIPAELFDLEFPNDCYPDDMMDFMDAWLPDGQFIQNPPAWFASLQGLLSQRNSNTPTTTVFHLAAEPESEQLCACRWLSYQYYAYFIVIDSLLDLHEWTSITLHDGEQSAKRRTLAFIRNLDLSGVYFQELVGNPYVDIIIPRVELPAGWQAHVLQLGPHQSSIDIQRHINLADAVALQSQMDSLPTVQQDMLRPLLEPKPLLAATTAVCLSMEEWATQLGADNHLTPVLDTLEAQTKIRALGNKALGFRPLLLIGEPGNAKSWISSQIAAVLGLPKFKIDLAGNGDRMLLVGSSRNWQNAAPGRIAQFLAESPVANPVIVIEEVDKALSGHDSGLQDLLLMLLEPENSRQFQDNFILASLDLSHASFILTANDVSCLSAPLLSRLQQIEIRRPSHAMMLQLAQQLYQRILLEMGIQAYFIPELPQELALQLVVHAPSIRVLRFNVHASIEAAVKGASLSELYRHQHSLAPKLPQLKVVASPRPPLGFLPSL